MHICPVEIGAFFIFLEGVLPYASAVWYAKVLPFLKRGEYKNYHNMD